MKSFMILFLCLFACIGCEFSSENDVYYEEDSGHYILRDFRNQSWVDGVEYHLNHKLSGKKEVMTTLPSDSVLLKMTAAQEHIARGLFAIDGIGTVEIRQFSVKLTIGKAYDYYGQIEPKVVSVLAKVFDLPEKTLIAP